MSTKKQINEQHIEHAYRYMLVIAYDGTGYSGWQMQPHGDSIQELIGKAVQVVLKEKVRIIGSGRTDAGVHALGQVAHFTAAKACDAHRLMHSLNGLLPHDIRILDIKQVSSDFHAQKSAIGKIYHYNICLEDIVLPFERSYVLHLKKKIDISTLKDAASLFVGTHDFSAFANSQTEGACAKNPVRTIYSIDVVKTERGVRLEFYGNGFLYKMVRNIVGMLLDVASHKRPLDDILRVLKSRDRKQASKAACAKGLFLMKVCYEKVS